MTLAYRNFAQYAAQSERAGNFTEAAALWQRAQSSASGINGHWAACRAEFCQHAAQRAIA
ncbi:ANR family transcriptional regulator [Erwinia aphidicola]|uniref:ANR family transcriptional regulator n=1 Tax=Erwinia aphidicola TaxID=68334 RepID=UPI003BB0CE7F